MKMQLAALNAGMVGRKVTLKTPDGVSIEGPLSGLSLDTVAHRNGGSHKVDYMVASVSLDIGEWSGSSLSPWLLIEVEGV